MSRIREQIVQLQVAWGRCPTGPPPTKLWQDTVKKLNKDIPTVSDWNGLHKITKRQSTVYIEALPTKGYIYDTNRNTCINISIENIYP